MTEKWQLPDWMSNWSKATPVGETHAEAAPNPTKPLNHEKAVQDQLTAMYRELHESGKSDPKADELIRMLQKIIDSRTAERRQMMATESLDDQLTYPLLSDRQLTLLNPASLNAGGVSMFRGASSIPEVNAITGDLRWSAESNTRFSEVKAILENLGTKVESVEFGKWSLEQMQAVCDSAVDAVLSQQAAPELKAMLKSMNALGLTESAWKSMGPLERETMLRTKLRSLIDATSFVADFRNSEVNSPDALRAKIKTPTREVSLGSRVGLEVTEDITDPSTGQVKQETFAIFLEQSDDNKTRSPMYEGSVKWSVVVRCPGGNETRYVFGETDFKITPLVRKPVIYLYPTSTTPVSVDLDYSGEIVAEYPKRVGNGWQVIAEPTGRLQIANSSRNYPYLFWEGKPTNNFSTEFVEGYCVAKNELVLFLEQQLAARGLSDAEAADFITYWYPIMSRNPYSLVRFATTEYTDSARLTIEPKPDTMIRLFMIFKSVAEPTAVAAPQVVSIQRAGFTAVEWGGLNLDE